jgi:hypothetical protein
MNWLRERIDKSIPPYFGCPKQARWQGFQGNPGQI